MKTEYIFTIDVQTDYATDKKFQAFLVSEMPTIFSKVNTTGSNKCIRSIGNVGSLQYMVKNCSNERCNNHCSLYCLCNYDVKTLTTENGKYIVHSVAFNNTPDCECEVFENEQKSFQDFICNNLDKFVDVKIVWDDNSMYNAKATYPAIYEIENLMRNFITKFMVMNIGKDWEKYVPQTLQNKAQKRDKSDKLNEFTSFLYNLDFIDLSFFLFKKYQKETDTSKLNQSNLSDFITMSNWERYFGKVITINENDFVQKWKELYNYRCKIAHNKFFTKDDIQATQKLIADIKKILEDALEVLANGKGKLLSSKDRIAFILHGISDEVKTNLTKIVNTCKKICVLKNWKNHEVDTMNFMPVNQQHWIVMSYFKFYISSMEMLKIIHAEMRTIYQQCEQFFSGNIPEEEENLFANLPDRMNALSEKMELYYLKEKYKEDK